MRPLVICRSLNNPLQLRVEQQAKGNLPLRCCLSASIVKWLKPEHYKCKKELQEQIVVKKRTPAARQMSMGM